MRHQDGCSFRAFSGSLTELLYFLLGLGLLTNASYFVSASSDEDGTGTTGYCHLCDLHTMCRYLFDDAGRNCSDVRNGDLDPEEIVSILHQHNEQRNHIARGLEERGNPGPQPPAKNMMELVWDEELARLARRWALQCQPYTKDKCRNVDRFTVWQNVNTIELNNDMEISDVGTSEDRRGPMDDDGNATDAASLQRIQHHVQSWIDEVEGFDAARVGLVDLSMENETSYVAIAGAKITRLGCGRAVYTVKTDESIDEVEGPRTGFDSVVVTEDGEIASNNNGITNRPWMEVLVCNYGPIDRSSPHNLYEYGTVERCPDGSLPSVKYDHLCVETEEPRDFLPRDSEDRNDEEGPRDPSRRGIVGSTDGEEERRSSSSSSSKSSGVSIALRKRTSATGRSTSFYGLAEFLSLVLLHIITKAPGARCCWSC